MLFCNEFRFDVTKDCCKKHLYVFKRQLTFLNLLS